MAFKDLHVRVCLSVCLSVCQVPLRMIRSPRIEPASMILLECPTRNPWRVLFFLCIFYYRLDTSDCPMRFSALLFSPMAEFTPTLPGRAYEITETLSNRNDVAYSRGLTAQPGCPAIRLGKIHTVSLYR